MNSQILLGLKASDYIYVNNMHASNFLTILLQIFNKRFSGTWPKANRYPQVPKHTRNYSDPPVGGIHKLTPTACFFISAERARMSSNFVIHNRIS